MVLSEFGFNRLDRDAGQGAARRVREHHPAPQRRAQAAGAAGEPGRRSARQLPATTTTDTAPGSSGSPVFNDQWEVVALHHMGVPKRNEHGDLLTLEGSHLGAGRRSGAAGVQGQRGHPREHPAAARARPVALGRGPEAAHGAARAQGARRGTRASTLRLAQAPGHRLGPRGPEERPGPERGGDGPRGQRGQRDELGRPSGRCPAGARGGDGPGDAGGQRGHHTDGAAAGEHPGGPGGAGRGPERGGAGVRARHPWARGDGSAGEEGGHEPPGTDGAGAGGGAQGAEAGAAPALLRRGGLTLGAGAILRGPRRGAGLRGAERAGERHPPHGAALRADAPRLPGGGPAAQRDAAQHLLRQGVRSRGASSARTRASTGPRADRFREVLLAERELGAEALAAGAGAAGGSAAVQLRARGAAVLVRQARADAGRPAPPVRLRVGLQQLPRQHAVLRLPGLRGGGSGGLRQAAGQQVRADERQGRGGAGDALLPAALPGGDQPHLHRVRGADGSRSCCAGTRRTRRTCTSSTGTRPSSSVRATATR